MWVSELTFSAEVWNISRSCSRTQPARQGFGIIHPHFHQDLGKGGCNLAVPPYWSPEGDNPIQIVSQWYWSDAVSNLARKKVKYLALNDSQRNPSRNIIHLREIRLKLVLCAFHRMTECRNGEYNVIDDPRIGLIIQTNISPDDSNLMRDKSENLHASSSEGGFWVACVATAIRYPGGARDWTASRTGLITLVSILSLETSSKPWDQLPLYSHRIR